MIRDLPELQRGDIFGDGLNKEQGNGILKSHQSLRQQYKILQYEQGFHFVFCRLWCWASMRLLELSEQNNLDSKIFGEHIN